MREVWLFLLNLLIYRVIWQYIYSPKSLEYIFHRMLWLNRHHSRNGMLTIQKCIHTVGWVNITVVGTGCSTARTTTVLIVIVYIWLANLQLSPCRRVLLITFYKFLNSSTAPLPFMHNNAQRLTGVKKFQTLFVKRTLRIGYVLYIYLVNGPCAFSTQPIYFLQMAGFLPFITSTSLCSRFSSSYCQSNRVFLRWSII